MCFVVITGGVGNSEEGLLMFNLQNKYNLPFHAPSEVLPSKINGCALLRQQHNGGIQSNFYGIEGNTL